MPGLAQFVGSLLGKVVLSAAVAVWPAEGAQRPGQYDQYVFFQLIFLFVFLFFGDMTFVMLL